MAQSALKKRAPKAKSTKAVKKVFRCREGRVIAPKRKDRKVESQLARKLGANAINQTERIMATRAAVDGRLSLLGSLVDKSALNKSRPHKGKKN